MAKRYCEMCDKWVSSRQYECRDCGAPTVLNVMPAREPETFGDLKQRLSRCAGGDWPSRVNNSMTHSEAIRILRDGLATYPDDMRLDATGSRGVLYTRNVLRECKERE